jgi:hypothetical protein
MKYCHHCGRLTSGEPMFCQFCGRSYDVKLCPRLHANPRWAEVCSQCGSRELSTPQPKVSFWNPWTFPRSAQGRGTRSIARTLKTHPLTHPPILWANR